MPSFGRLTWKTSGIQESFNSTRVLQHKNPGSSLFVGLIEILSIELEKSEWKGVWEGLRQAIDDQTQLPPGEQRSEQRLACLLHRLLVSGKGCRRCVRKQIPDSHVDARGQIGRYLCVSVDVRPLARLYVHPGSFRRFWPALVRQVSDSVNGVNRPP